MPATRAGRALVQVAADYGVCDEYLCIVGYLTLLLRPYCVSSLPAVSFPFWQTRLVYPQLFLPISLRYHYDASMINALDYVAPDTIEKKVDAPS
jgi:hypothetical protein